ncbi:DUF1819 family protein [Pseudoalteromonas sp. MEBiC 03485]|uniref:DUF1819 family protein n=1 Tax=Pseudoalteromonas sp. MEBiC 03485 TaxID=2571103 RepID=UPI00102047BD|nr:DUF1819 family protein [Pseudoalteromonas sp. MEBiC 03485]RZD20084.1 DUF1819 family protein [Pseudoalteromonas sp. MEBiC 03485]
MTSTNKPLNKQAIKKHKDYLGDLIGGSLMIKESQIVAELLLKKPSQEEWLDAIVNRNILQKRSDASAKRNAATIKKRIENMPDEYLEQVAFGSTELSTQLMFAATLINSTLLADFMRNVVLDAKRMFRESLDVGDWESYWEDRCRLFPDLANMSDASTYKISQVAFKAIADGGYIETTRNKKLQNVYLLPEVRQLLLSIDREDIIAAMELI